MFLPPKTLQQWLKIQCQILPICTQGLVMASAPGQIATWPEAREPSEILKRVLSQALTEQSLSILADGEHHLVFAHPIMIEGRPWGAIALGVATQDKNVILNLLTHLKHGFIWLEFLQGQSEGRESQKSAQPEASLYSLISSVLLEKTLGQASMQLVNSLATSLGANRVSLALHQDASLTLAAISCSAQFDPRTAAMQLLLNAMSEALDQGRHMHFSPGRPMADAPLIDRCHALLAQSQQALEIHTLVLRSRDHNVGALLIEYSHRPDDWRQLDAITQALPALTQVLELKHYLSASLWRQLKNRLGVFLGKLLGNSQRRLKILAATLAGLALMLVTEVDYKLVCDANVESVQKNLLVAPQDGFLQAIKARPGDSVKKGDLLAQLKADDLQLEERKMASQRVQSQQEYDNALANANRAQAAIANEKVEQASIQLRLIEQQLARTQLIAPVDGIISSDEISQTLGAPVKQGQTLFEISAAQGYRVQLFVDERDIAMLKVNQEGQLKLTSLPGAKLAFRVTNITPISEIRNGRNYFRVEAKLESETGALRPGMTGTGKVWAGHRALAWVWFHDLWYWLRLTLWL